MRKPVKTRAAAAVLIILLLCGVLPGAALSEDVRYTADGYAYTVSYGYAQVIAYSGAFLPRTLPDSIDGYTVYLEYRDDIFSHLIRESGIYRYGRVAENEIYIVGWCGYEPVAMIPADIGGIPVTGIGDKAFWLSGCERETFADTVVVPDSVRYIGREAFSCTGIVSVYLGSGVREIGDLAFQGLSQSNFVLPAGVEKLGINPFADHVDLGYVNGYLFPWPESTAHFRVAESNGSMLYGTEDMRLITYRADLSPQWRRGTVVTVPDGIRVIGSHAFYAAQGITEVVLPDTVEIIEPYAFIWSGELTRVRIPESVTVLGKGAFESTAITELEIPSGVTVIGDILFHSWAPEEATIVCDPGSAAEAYAKANGYRIRFR
ncbi:MAG: leucine-rich repeat protein [Clostridia bacterium]|nr:leucine-rich repeat protein [Clostridia bacterium]